MLGLNHSLVRIIKSLNLIEEKQKLELYVGEKCKAVRKKKRGKEPVYITTVARPDYLLYILRFSVVILESHSHSTKSQGSLSLFLLVLIYYCFSFLNYYIFVIYIYFYQFQVMFFFPFLYYYYYFLAMFSLPYGRFSKA